MKNINWGRWFVGVMFMGVIMLAICTAKCSGQGVVKLGLTQKYIILHGEQKVVDTISCLIMYSDTSENDYVKIAGTVYYNYDKEVRYMKGYIVYWRINDWYCRKKFLYYLDENKRRLSDSYVIWQTHEKEWGLKTLPFDKNVLYFKHEITEYLNEQEIHWSNEDLLKMLCLKAAKEGYSFSDEMIMEMDDYIPSGDEIKNYIR